LPENDSGNNELEEAEDDEDHKSVNDENCDTDKTDQEGDGNDIRNDEEGRTQSKETSGYVYSLFLFLFLFFFCFSTTPWTFVGFYYVLLIFPVERLFPTRGICFPHLRRRRLPHL
jgi:hypothetical protein